ncbi:MAG: hypothetical protein ABIR83_09230 [Nakamurella sp.]
MEIIVVANDLSSQIEARRVQVAVMLAYEAMSVSAETPMPVLASSRRAQGHPRTSAEADPFTHPEVQAYLVSTSQEMGRLSAELAKAQENMSGPKQSGVVDQRRQLEDLVFD